MKINDEVGSVKSIVQAYEGESINMMKDDYLQTSNADDFIVLFQMYTVHRASTIYRGPKSRMNSLFYFLIVVTFGLPC